MKVEAFTKNTKKGIQVEFKSAACSEAQLMIDYLKQVCGETKFLLNDAEGINYTLEAEEKYIKDIEDNEKSLMLNAYVDGKLVGNGSFSSVNAGKRLCHRANMGIAIFLDYCSQGIGELLSEMLIEKARECGYEIMELEVFAKNSRAIALYEKLGFEKCGLRKNAFKYKDGTYDDEILMQLFL